MSENYMNFEKFELDYTLIDKIALSQLKKYHFIPIQETHNTIVIASDERENIELQELLHRIFINKKIEISLLKSTQIIEYLSKIEIKFKIEELVVKIIDELHSYSDINQENSSSILTLINIILSDCIEARASDIHIEPTQNRCLIRARVDGRLIEIFSLKKEIYPPLSSRVKLLANLDIAKKMQPQDGRFSALIKSIEYDFRVSTLPIIFGESIVLRVLDKQKAVVALEESGMDTLSYQKFIRGLKSPYGVVLLTGPTGSGKQQHSMVH